MQAARSPVKPWTVLGLAPLGPDGLRGLLPDLPIDAVVPRTRDPDGVAELIGSADIVIGDWSGELSLTPDLIAKASQLCFVQQPGIGLDGLDVACLAAAGIPVANTARVNASEVAEWCLASALASLHRLAWIDAQMHSDGWPRGTVVAQGIRELSTCTVGIIGMGAIGRECAVRFSGIAAEVLHWSRQRREPDHAGGSRWTPLHSLLPRSDVLVVTIALSDETRHLMSAERLALLPQGAHVVNAARGAVIDEVALAAAIDAGHVAGAALDVFATEPLPLDSPLRAMDRVLLSPHVAGASMQAQTRLVNAVADNVSRAIRGEPVINVVNGVSNRVRRRWPRSQADL